MHQDVLDLLRAFIDGNVRFSSSALGE